MIGIDGKEYKLCERVSFLNMINLLLVNNTLIFDMEYEVDESVEMEWIIEPIKMIDLEEYPNLPVLCTLDPDDNWLCFPINKITMNAMYVRIEVKS